MRRPILMCVALGALYTVVGSGLAHANPETRPQSGQEQQQPSLGEIARQARKAKEERDKSATPPKNVFTDENFPSGGAANTADLARLDNPQTSVSDRVAGARAMLERAGHELDTLEPMDRATLAKAALQGREGDFPGRRAWEEKLFASKQHYVAHGRDLIRQTQGVLDELSALTSGGKVSPSDPRAQELGLKARRLMQDAFQTEADFQAVVLEGADLAKQAAPH